jgi:peptidoglycan DL-endopeptidase CwlO
LWKGSRDGDPRTGVIKDMPGLSLVAPAILFAPVAGLTALAVLIGGTSDVSADNSFPGLTGGSVCATSGPIAGMSAAQAQNARGVAATASARASDHAALIAVMTGLAESGMRVLANPNDPTGSQLANQGVGHDHDSLGIFQQRASWGTAAQRMDPAASTNLFLDALLRRPDWSSVEPWRAAQDVQQSAFTGVPSPSNGFSHIYGGNYLAQAGEAAHIVDLIKIDSAKLDCGSGPGDPPTGPIGANGLPVGYRIPTGASAAARAAVMFALDQRGKPYVFGATGPGAYDCSGLTLSAWANAGITITRTTYTQRNGGTATRESSLRPGDLVLVPGSDGSLASPGHVGMFIGEGLVIHAPHTGDVVKVVTFKSFTAKGISALRHIA